MSTGSLAAGVLGLLYKVTLLTSIIEYCAFTYCISILSVVVGTIKLSK